MKLGGWWQSLSLYSAAVRFFDAADDFPGACSFPKELDFCATRKLSKSPLCKLGPIENANMKMYYTLDKLLRQPFFRYFKVNLSKSCPFWDESLECFSDQCAIDFMKEDPAIPKSLPLLTRENDRLNDIKFPNLQKSARMIERLEIEEGNFCAVDNDDCDGVYVDLVENPERFTNYSGPAAHRIWSAVYNENCFISESVPSGIIKDWYACEERKLFYRVVSGLHASISVHLSDRYFNSEKGRWESNFRMFHDRVGAHPERVQNLYVVYTLLLRAVTKMQPQMSTMSFSTREDDNTRIKALFEKFYKTCPKYSKKFDSRLFAISPNHAEQLKVTFRNLARLMDCVACQRCRLWGKVQIYGIGTALKILTSQDASELKLSRGEIITLFNAFGRLSESVMSIENFRVFYGDAEKSQAAAEFRDLRIVFGSVFILLLSTGLLFFKPKTLVANKS